MAPSAALAEHDGFSLGVASAEITTDSARIWGHAKHSGPINVRVARDPDFGRVVERRTLQSRGSNNRTIQTVVDGLRPGESYFYRFCDPVDGEGPAKVEAAVRRNRCSDTGRFVTTPKPSRSETIEFSYLGDYDAQPKPGQSDPFWNDFQIFDRVVEERNDFNVAIGDTIYSDTEVRGVTDDAVTVREKWGKYRQNLAQDELARARGSAAFYSQWDDHEFLNDFYKKKDRYDLGSGADGRTIRIDGNKLYRRGVRAFRDYAPVSFSKDRGLYRSVRYGKNLELFFLDQRSFRDPNADQGGTCDNRDTNEPDLAPTAPQRTRDFFSVAAPSLAEEVPRKCKRRIRDEDRSFLGEDQLDRFKREVDDSNANFKVVINETPIQQFYVLPYDRWEGFEAERQEVLRFLRDKVENVVFLTEDFHASIVNDARLRTLEDNGPKNTGILEAVASPVATANASIEFERETNVEGVGRLVDDLFFEPPPPQGLGMQCSVVDQFNYGNVTVTDDELTIRPRNIDGQPLQQEDGTPCGPFTIERE